MVKADKKLTCDCGCGMNCDCSGGRRCSSRRRAVFHALAGAKKHLTAEQVYRAVSSALPGTGIATVYRSLKCLCGCGKARELKFGDRPAVYEALGARPTHGHLVCRSCGDISEFVDPAAERLGARLAAAHGFSPGPALLEIHGTCARCAAVTKEKK